MKNIRVLSRIPISRRLAVLSLLVPAALGFSASQARAAGETLTLVQDDPAAVVGQATNFTASGSLNPEDTMFGFDIFIFVKDADADPTCAPDFEDESATAMHSGGNETWVSPPGGFEVGMGPSFEQPFKITFTGGGNYLLCGYVQGDFSTFAAGELRGSVAEAPSTTPPSGSTTKPPSGSTTPGTTPAVAVPAVVRAPWITRKGHLLTCHAGSWKNAPTSFSYRWYVAGRSVASGRTLTVRRSMKGHDVVCRVTASNAAGTKTAPTRALRAG